MFTLKLSVVDEQNLQPLVSFLKIIPTCYKGDVESIL